MVRLRNIKISDKKYFSKWWRDESLIKLTSGDRKRITNQEVDKYFDRIIKDHKNKQYIITVQGKAIGHIALEYKRNGWYETQIIIGDKKQQNKGYGTRAIKQVLKKAQKFGIKNVYLEVRPDNLRAINVYEKCGFRKAGIKKYPHNKYLSQTLKMVINF